MKLYAIVIGLFSPLIFKGQDSLLYQIFPVKDNRVIYEKVIDIPGQKKDSLFLKAKLWALSTFNSSKEAFQIEDRTGGLMAYRTFFRNNFISPTIMGVSSNYDYEYWSQIRIYLKDSKAKIVIENENVKTNYQGFSGTYYLYTMKNEIDDTYNKSMVGKKYRERYWEALQNNFKIADEKYKKLIASFEFTVTAKDKSEADF